MQPDLLISEAPVPAVHKSAPRKRTINRNATGDAKAALGSITKGCEIYALTNGQFSVIDIIEHVLDATGPADISLATWTAADGDLRRAHAFLLSGRIKSMRLLIDPSFKTRQPKYCETLVSIFGNDAIRTTPLHGKFVTISNEAWNIVIRTSMNLNTNKRIETVEISDDPDLFDFMQETVDGFFAKPAAANFTSQSREQNARHDIGARLAF